MASYKPVPLPEHLPERLTISLWDFSWYVRSGPGEPFEDLDAAVSDAVARGYNTIRICAMPFLLFGSGLDTSAVSLDRLGGEYAQRVRWYDVKSPTVFDGRAKLLELFEACKRHDVFIILSSWEYQQSSSFSTTRDWWDALMSVEPDQRAVRLAEAQAALIDFVAERGLDDRIAFTELHNEVQAGYLTEGLSELIAVLDDGVRDLDGPAVSLKPRLSAGLRRFHELAPTRPVTVNYARVIVGGFRGIPDEVDALVFHPYVYGPLNEITEAFDLRGSLAQFPFEQVKKAGLLRKDAPAPESWVLTGDAAWKMDATIVGKPEIYLHDWVNEEAFDRFLYERHQAHSAEMERVLRIWTSAASDLAQSRGVPLFFAEGWVGYTPLDGNFEEGPVGADFCRKAIRESLRARARGTIVCSNASPAHPMWADIDLQRSCNEAFLSGDVSRL